MIASVDIPVSWIGNGLTALWPTGALILSAITALTGAYLLRRIWDRPAEQVSIFDILMITVLLSGGLSTFIVSLLSSGFVRLV